VDRGSVAMAIDNDIGARARKHSGNRLADIASRAGDDRGAPLQRLVFEHYALPLSASTVIPETPLRGSGGTAGGRRGAAARRCRRSGQPRSAAAGILSDRRARAAWRGADSPPSADQARTRE